MFSAFEIDQLHDSCTLAGTDLLSIPPVCKDLDDSNYVEIPVSSSALSTACNQPAEFVYKGTPAVYTDLKNSQIYLTAVLEHKDGTKIEPDEPVGPINFLGKNNSTFLKIHKRSILVFSLKTIVFFSISSWSFIFQC